MATTTTVDPNATRLSLQTNNIGPLIYQRYTTTATTQFDATGDTIKFNPLPQHANIAGGFVIATDMDTNGTPTLTFDVVVTNGTLSYKLVEATTIAQAGGILTFPIAGQAAAVLANYGVWTTKVTTAAYWVELVVVTGAATAAVGSLTLCVLGTQGKLG